MAVNFLTHAALAIAIKLIVLHRANVAAIGQSLRAFNFQVRRKRLPGDAGDAADIRDSRSLRGVS